MPKSLVIVGGGAAGNAAAEALRRQRYSGRITVLPRDRPNLSKGYLAGTATEGSTRLRSAAYYSEQDIDMRLHACVVKIDTASRNVQLAEGSEYRYDALLLATGATPIRLEAPGADLSHVHYLRTLADSRALVARAKTSRQAVVIGASFIGLEVTASLRTRNIEVHVVGRETVSHGTHLGKGCRTQFKVGDRVTHHPSSKRATNRSPSSIL